MNNESLVALVKETKDQIINFENKVFKERTSEYSIYRAETSIYLDTIKFLEKMVQYELNAEEIEAVETNIKEIQAILAEDEKNLNMNSEVISAPVETATVDEFKTINFDTISEEVNSTSDDYASIDNFITNELPA